MLRGRIPEELMRYVPSSFDVIGSRSGAVAVVEIPNELEQYKYLIAEAIRSLNKNVRAVLRRVGARKGMYRLYDYEVLIPGPTEVIHKEHGYLLKLDPTKVYFSPRDQTDRAEVSSMVRPGELILYPFAGVGPYGIAIAKKVPDVTIYAVEINEYAVRYMVENISLNSVGRSMVAIRGDAGEVLELFKREADRVVMPLPLEGVNYLAKALCSVRDGGWVHYYALLGMGHEWDDARRIVQVECSRVGAECLVEDVRVLREYSPRLNKARIDIRVVKSCT